MEGVLAAPPRRSGSSARDLSGAGKIQKPQPHRADEVTTSLPGWRHPNPTAGGEGVQPGRRWRERGPGLPLRIAARPPRARTTCGCPNRVPPRGARAWTESLWKLERRAISRAPLLRLSVCDCLLRLPKWSQFRRAGSVRIRADWSDGTGPDFGPPPARDVPGSLTRQPRTEQPHVPDQAHSSSFLPRSSAPLQLRRSPARGGRRRPSQPNAHFPPQLTRRAPTAGRRETPTRLRVSPADEECRRGSATTSRQAGERCYSNHPWRPASRRAPPDPSGERQFQRSR